MTTFLVSDTHFGHESTCTKFTNSDGSPLRPFANADEMDEAMIQLWNETVKPEDTVIHLGDVVISHRHLHKIGLCNGKKILVQGNHDPIGGKKGRKFNFDDYFEDVVAYKLAADIIMTHIPLHPDCVQRFGTNVHGHLHDNQVMWQNPIPELRHTLTPDPRYICVSVEHTGFKPITLEEVRSWIAFRQQAAGFDPTTAWGNGSGPG